MKDNEMYTHDEAAAIVELFENVLDQYGISIPSSDDSERGEDNDAKLYGDTYSDLLDNVENHLIHLLDRHKPDTNVVLYEFSGNF
jgi:hypothetical protein